MKTRLLLVFLVAALALPTGAGASAPTPVAASVRDCHTYASYPNVLISSARNISCRSAVSDFRRYRVVSKQLLQN